MADDNKPTLLVVEECAQTYHSRGPGAGRRRARRGDRHGDGDEALDLVVATRTVVDSSRFGNRPGGGQGYRRIARWRSSEFADCQEAVIRMGDSPEDVNEPDDLGCPVLRIRAPSMKSRSSLAHGT
jgi:hypothetical protein